jgi:hypothetical protein
MDKLDIYNMALNDAGQKELTSTSGTSAMHVVLNSTWAKTFKTHLELYDWAFARQDLLLVEQDTMTSYDGWAYEYQWPGDCLVPRNIHAQGSIVPQAFEYRLRSESPDTAAKTIFSNLGDAYCTFTRLLDDTVEAELNLLDSAFVESLVLNLQGRILMKVTQDPKRVQFIKALFDQARGIAETATASQRVRRGVQGGVEDVPRAIAARR